MRGQAAGGQPRRELAWGGRSFRGRPAVQFAETSRRGPIPLGKRGNIRRLVPARTGPGRGSWGQVRRASSASECEVRLGHCSWARGRWESVRAGSRKAKGAGSVLGCGAEGDGDSPRLPPPTPGHEQSQELLVSRCRGRTRRLTEVREEGAALPLPRLPGGQDPALAVMVELCPGLCELGTGLPPPARLAEHLLPYELPERSGKPS